MLQNYIFWTYKECRIWMLIPGKSHSQDLKHKSRDSFKSPFGPLLSGLLSNGNECVQGPSPAGGFADPATSGGGGSESLKSPWGMRPNRRRGVVAVGGLSQWRCINCCRASEHRPAPASMTCRWPPLRGWSQWCGVVRGVLAMLMLLCYYQQWCFVSARAAEADHLYTTRPDVLCRLITRCTLRRELWYLEAAQIFTHKRSITNVSQQVDL